VTGKKCRARQILPGKFCRIGSLFLWFGQGAISENRENNQSINALTEFLKILRICGMGLATDGAGQKAQQQNAETTQKGTTLCCLLTPMLVLSSLFRI
jgi:hypothetical protein